MFNQLFTIAIKNRSRVIFVFKILYLILAVYLVLSVRAALVSAPDYLDYYMRAITFGQVGLTLYCVTLIPGMARRFGVQHRLIQLIMLFRRYIGITVFLCVMIHFWTIRGYALLQLLFDRFFPLQLFEIFGLSAYLLLLPMFLTSNDFSTKVLGVWWHRLHKVTYAIMFLIFLHVITQRVSEWSILMGIAAILNALSFPISWFRKRAPVPAAA